MVSDNDSGRALNAGATAGLDARRRRFCVLWALLLLPLFLGAVAVAGSATHLRFLLFPPLAAIGFALFLDPYSRRVSLRSVVAGPVSGALIGVAALAWLPAGPWRSRFSRCWWGRRASPISSQSRCPRWRSGRSFGCGAVWCTPVSIHLVHLPLR